MKKRFRHNSLFNRLFTLITSVAVLVTGVNLVGNLFLRQQLVENGLSDQRSYIKAYANSMDDVFLNIDNVFTYLSVHSAIVRVGSAEYDQTRDFLQNEETIFHTLSTFSYTTNNFVDIFLLTADGTGCYTAGGYTAPQTYFKNRYTGNYAQWLQTVSSHYTKMSVQRIPQHLITPSTGDSARYTATTLYGIRTISAGQRIIGNLVVCISDKLTDSVFAESSFSDGRFVFICDNQNNVISSNTDLALEDIAHNTDTLLHDDEQYADNKGLTSVCASAQSGLRYVIFTPISMITGSFDRIFTLLNIFSCALMLMLIMYGYLATKRIYRPFRSIVDTLRDINNGKPAEYGDETEFVKNRVLDIVSVNYTLHNAVQDSSPLILETVLFKMLRGSPSLEESLEVANPYGLVFPNGAYSAFVVRMELQPESDEQFEIRYYNRLMQILKASLEQWQIAVLETDVDEYTVVSHFSSGQEPDTLMEVLKTMREELMREIPHSRFTIGYGGTVNSILQLRECYVRALNAIRRKKVGDESAVLQWSDRAQPPFFLPADLEVELTGMLRAGYYEVACEYINQQFSYNARLGICVEEYLQMCYTVNGFLLRFIRNKSTALYRNTIHIDPHTSLYSTGRLNEIVLFNLSVLADSASDPTREPDSAVDRILKYVGEHCTQDINLAIVAAELGYTPNYLSRLFKQAKGINFTDYINRKRVEFAKQALRTTSKTIKQIAQEAGFNSTTLFIRTFERYEGLTPGEYRKVQ